MTGLRRLARGAFTVSRATAAVAVLARLARGARMAGPVTVPAPALPGGTTISVVIPARNEENRLGRCLAALAGAPGVDEVIVVDDESSDATAAVARAGGARVVRGEPLPDGWAGKCWALQQGLTAATGEWVVTLDADTVPHPELPAAAVARARADGWDLLTLTARFECPTAALQVLHPALLTTLVYRFGPPGAGPDRRPPRRPLANGQCQVLRRAPFLAAGGFGPVRQHLTEDVALARWMTAAGGRVGFLDGSPALAVRMHESAAGAWREWGRSLPLADLTPPLAMVGDLGVVWLAQALPLVRLAARRGDALDVVLALARVGTLAATRPAYDRPGAAYWLSPVADAAAAARLTQGALRPERTWRGRTYGRGPGPGRGRPLGRPERSARR